MAPGVLLAVYCVLILVASLAGGWVAFALKLTHRQMEVVNSAVAGFILGVGLLHLVPHAVGEGLSIGGAMRWIIGGLLVMFFLERFFSFHQHEIPEEDQEAREENGDPGQDHGHGHAPMHGYPKLTWSGAAVGLTVHSMIAGMALAASLEAGQSGLHGGVLASLPVFLVIFLHKPLDSLALGSLMASGRWSAGARHVVNALFALAIPLGAVVYCAGTAWGGDMGGLSATGPALAFSAGMFLCIALSDLLPELQFHRHDRGKLSAALLIGLATAWAISHFESQSHGHEAHHGSHGDASQHESHLEGADRHHWYD